MRLASADGVLQAAASARVQGPWRPDELAEGIVRVLADRYEVEEADGVLELTVEKSLEAPAERCVPTSSRSWSSSPYRAEPTLEARNVLGARSPGSGSEPGSAVRRPG